MARQFTMKLDEGLLEAAKVHAARHRTTVSDLVRRKLAEEVGWSPPAAATGPSDDDVEAVLEKFCAGRVKLREAMAALGIDPLDYGEFLALMAAKGRRWPAPDKEAVDKAAEAMVRAIREARGAAG